MSGENGNKFSRTLHLNKKLDFTLSDETGFALSIFYGIFVVNLAIVCIVTQYVASVGPLDISEYYINFLFLIAVFWLIGFAISVKWGRNRNDLKKPVKSHHASNRWLKGVMAIFGFSIIVKNTLELFAIANVNSSCLHKSLHILQPILFSPFVFGQVTFLFLFAKHHLQEWRHFARFGIIHIMATNLSVWLQTIAGEATEAMSDEMKLNERNILPDANVDHTLTTKVVKDDFIVGDMFRGNCTCRNIYCRRVAQTDAFLFPFMIEFCLISTCLLYVTWRKVGKKPKPAHEIFKPCYKLYRAYKGPTCGALVLTITVTVIVLLGASDQPSPGDTYLNKSDTLHLYEGFLTCCEFIIMVACLWGIQLYRQSKKPRIQNFGLDLVLLFVCFVGPLIAGLFSILSLTIKNDKEKALGWEISLLYPIVDVVGTIVQILFIVYGMQHAPISAANTTKSSVEGTQFSNKTRGLHSNKQNLCNNHVEHEALTRDETGHKYDNLPSGNHHTGEIEKNLLSMSLSDASYQPKPENVEKIPQALPDNTRTVLREILMFLVISNASLWVFLSLDKTVFVTLTYQYEYFGHGVWSTIAAVTTPLSIFLRMHSSACCFELWAYA